MAVYLFQYTTYTFLCLAGYSNYIFLKLVQNCSIDFSLDFPAPVQQKTYQLTNKIAHSRRNLIQSIGRKYIWAPLFPQPRTASQGLHSHVMYGSIPEQRCAGSDGGAARTLVFEPASMMQINKEQNKSHRLRGWGPISPSANMRCTRRIAAGMCVCAQESGGRRQEN